MIADGVDLDIVTNYSTLILAGVSIVGALFGVVSWLDKRMDTKIVPILEAMREVREDIGTIQRNQLHIAEKLGLHVAHRKDGPHVIDPEYPDDE